MNKLALGVDIGATNIRVAVGDLSRILFKTSEKTVSKGDEYTVANQIIKIAGKIPEKLIRRIAGVGIGSIGPINIRRGIIVNPPNLPFKKISVVEPLIDKFRVPVYLVNDCVAAGIGEKFFGAGGKVDDLV
jgi:glucokinase